MLNVDPKILAKLRPGLERVVVFDPQQAAGRMTGELLKDMGAKHVVCASDTRTGLLLIAHVAPNLICTELSGADFDGAELTARLRRSELPARFAPVIVVSAEATVERIKSARDSGAHEFLRKPFTVKDLFLRVENVIVKPRDWVQARMYVGPDRRRFNSGDAVGPAGRRAEDPSGGNPPAKLAAAPLAASAA